MSDDRIVSMKASPGGEESINEEDAEESLEELEKTILSLCSGIEERAKRRQTGEETHRHQSEIQQNKEFPCILSPITRQQQEVAVVTPLNRTWIGQTQSTPNTDILHCPPYSRRGLTYPSGPDLEFSIQEGDLFPSVDNVYDDGMTYEELLSEVSRISGASLPSKDQKQNQLSKIHVEDIVAASENQAVQDSPKASRLADIHDDKYFAQASTDSEMSLVGRFTGLQKSRHLFDESSVAQDPAPSADILGLEKFVCSDIDDDEEEEYEENKQLCNKAEMMLRKSATQNSLTQNSIEAVGQDDSEPNSKLDAVVFCPPALDGVPCISFTVSNNRKSEKEPGELSSTLTEVESESDNSPIKALMMKIRTRKRKLSKVRNKEKEEGELSTTTDDDKMNNMEMGSKLVADVQDFGSGGEEDITLVEKTWLEQKSCTDKTYFSSASIVKIEKLQRASAASENTSAVGKKGNSSIDGSSDVALDGTSDINCKVIDEATDSPSDHDKSAETMVEASNGFSNVCNNVGATNLPTVITSCDSSDTVSDAAIDAPSNASKTPEKSAWTSDGSVQAATQGNGYVSSCSSDIVDTVQSSSKSLTAELAAKVVQCDSKDLLPLSHDNDDDFVLFLSEDQEEINRVLLGASEKRSPNSTLKDKILFPPVADSFVVIDSPKKSIEESYVVIDDLVKGTLSTENFTFVKVEAETEDNTTQLVSNNSNSPVICRIPVEENITLKSKKDGKGKFPSLTSQTGKEEKTTICAVEEMGLIPRTEADLVTRAVGPLLTALSPILAPKSMADIMGSEKLRGKCPMEKKILEVEHEICAVEETGLKAVSKADLVTRAVGPLLTAISPILAPKSTADTMGSEKLRGKCPMEKKILEVKHEICAVEETGLKAVSKADLVTRAVGRPLLTAISPILAPKGKAVTAASEKLTGKLKCAMEKKTLEAEYEKCAVEKIDLKAGTEADLVTRTVGRVLLTAISPIVAPKSKADTAGSEKLPGKCAMEKKTLKVEHETHLMKSVRMKWKSKGIQRPDENLTFISWLRKDDKDRKMKPMFYLEGKSRIPPLFRDNMVPNKDALVTECQTPKSKKRRTSRSPRGGSDAIISDLHKQLFDIEAEQNHIAELLNQQHEAKISQMRKQHAQYYQALRTKQNLERRQHYHMYSGFLAEAYLEYQLMLLSQEHTLQVHQLDIMNKTELSKLMEIMNEEKHVQERRFELLKEPKRQMLKTFTQQSRASRAQMETTTPHATVDLWKGPCKSNHRQKSLVQVCLPTDIANFMIREDEIYDAYYVY